MKFIKYNDIENSYREKIQHRYQKLGFCEDSIKWCNTEKGHGSNLGIYVSNDGVKYAKRKSFIGENEDFYSHKRIIESKQGNFLNLWNHVKKLELYKDIDGLIIFGEIMGGTYPHPDVKKIKNVKRCQKGIYYSPDIEFYAFDILLVRGEDRTYMDYNVACSFFEMFEIFHAKILFTGTFNECLSYPNNFLTKIPEQLGYPQIEDNICEGFVMKPIVAIMDGFRRVILKNKNERSSEKNGQQKHFSIEQQITISDKLKTIITLISPYINENRLRNVLSKFGNFEEKNFREIYELFREDLYKDFSKDYNLIDELDSRELKLMNKYVGKLCVNVWRPIFLREL